MAGCGHTRHQLRGGLRLPHGAASGHKNSASLGQAVKIASSCEEKNKAIARKSIIAKKEISKGEVLTENNLMIKRPGTGIPPNQYYEILGSKAVDNFKPEQLIRIDSV